MSKNYQVTIGYTAVISIDIKADDETLAKKQALEIFKKARDKMIGVSHISLNDDSYNAYGILNMDETWNKL